MFPPFGFWRIVEVNMELVKKLKDVVLSVAPILAYVLVFQCFSPMPPGYLGNFLLGTLFLILGLTLFLVGVDISLVPMGEKIGSSMMKRRSLFLLLFAGFIVGFSVTFAEPNAEVLASQVSMVNPSIDATQMLLMLSIGVGVAIALAFLRLLFHVPLRFFLLGCYVVVFVLAFIGNGNFISLGFDSGGSATGPLAVPFLMALGIGSAKVNGEAKEMDNFGFVSMQGVGAIIAVLAMGLFSPVSKSKGLTFSYALGNFGEGFVSYFASVALSMLPLVVIILLFQFIALHMPRTMFLRVVIGLGYSYFGMVLFLNGARGGFMPIAFHIGSTLASTHKALLLVSSFLLGAFVVLAEPSVHVLVEQVEEISKGRITKRMMLVFLSLGVALSLVAVTFRVLYGFSLLWIMVPGYLLSFILLFTGPGLFGAIAFDSGGVAAGPIAATFILPFVIGVGVDGDPFGAIGCISMAPLLAIQLLGLLYQKKAKRGGIEQ